MENSQTHTPISVYPYARLFNDVYEIFISGMTKQLSNRYAGGIKERRNSK